MSVGEIEPKQARRLLDILDYSRKAVAFTGGIDLAALKSNEMLRLSLERCFEVIGEAARHLTEKTATALIGLPLQEMRSIRNLISHDYHRIKPEIILKTAQQDLPMVVAVIEPHEQQLQTLANLKLPPA